MEYYPLWLRKDIQLIDHSLWEQKHEISRNKANPIKIEHYSRYEWIHACCLISDTHDLCLITAVFLFHWDFLHSVYWQQTHTATQRPKVFLYTVSKLFSFTESASVVPRRTLCFMTVCQTIFWCSVLYKSTPAFRRYKSTSSINTALDDMCGDP